MKGFLQRVAASVIRPAPRTHPLVESIYAAGPAPDMAAPSLEFESTVRPAPTEPRMSESSGYGLHEDHTANRFAGPSRRAVQDRFEPLVQSSRASFGMDTVLKETRRPEEITETPPNAGGESNAGHPLSKIRARVLGELPNVVERFLESKADERAIVPQVEGKFAMPAQLHRATDVQTGAAQVNARRQALQPSRESEGLPEDIQIHIGRIEVLAVPQATPRPAAAPARKGLNLDEYLSRRNGRAG